MAVGLKVPEQVAPIAGVRFGVTGAGIRYQGRDDLVIMAFDEGSRVACSFTRNRFSAAPVQLAKEHIAASSVRFALINSGNANAGTGSQGMDSARQSCAVLAELSELQPETVLPFSTGVIGEQLPMERMVSGVKAAYEGLGEADWRRAAQAIMTTDTLPKLASRTVEINGKAVNITGMAKGSGMICPDMATMLAYVATDADIAGKDLSELLVHCVDGSFNSISVDGDTSTNDACLLVATGASGVSITPSSEGWNDFKRALEDVFQTLAQAIIRDGEGATKFISIHVSGAENEADARSVAYTLAHSPLFKTAAFASDPNWGRILAAVGRAPCERLEIQKVGIALGDVSIIEAGEPAPAYREEDGQRVMTQQEIDVYIDLGLGAASSTVWTSDLSHEYVRINAEYRS